jgi:hypothetical protein
VRNLIIPISVGLLSSSFTIVPEEKAGNPISVSSFPVTSNNDSVAAPASTASLYENMGLKLLGLSEEAFNNAWKGYNTSLNKTKWHRSNISLSAISASLHHKKDYT